MSKVRSLFLGLVAVLAIALVPARAQMQSIVEIAAGNEDFSTLVELVTAAGLVDALSGEGPFTVFAPTNEAFAELPEFVVNYVVSNPDLLTSILTYHVVAGKVMSTDLSDGMTAATLQGGELDIAVDEGVKVDGVSVVAADIEASNGVIHVINQVLLPELPLPPVDPLSVSDNIIIAGSSTVFPVTERMADLFNQEGFAGTITVDNIGTGAGFSRFCVAGETDISNASRPIKQSEIDSCRAIGREPIGFFVAIDALSVVVAKSNDFVTNLTLEQLQQIFSGAVTNWNQVDPSYPDAQILLFSPGTDSGTFDFFVEEVMENNRELILGAANIQFSEDDNVLVQGVEGSRFAIGYFGSAYLFPNIDRLNAVSIEGVQPTAETAETGEYPLSRPLFIYSTASIMREKPQVAEFINFYLQNVRSQLGAEPGQVAYFPVGKRTARFDELEFLAAISGS
ncbi:phosphate ABC transporter substrate-binding protein PstS family protein [Aggregatilineales bacterium SYSU G02658]